MSTNPFAAYTSSEHRYTFGSDQKLMLQANQIAALLSLIGSGIFFALDCYPLGFYLIVAAGLFYTFSFFVEDGNLLVRYGMVLNICLLVLVCTAFLNSDINLRFLLIFATLFVFHIFSKAEQVHRILLMVLCLSIFIYMEIWGLIGIGDEAPLHLSVVKLMMLKTANLFMAILLTLFIIIRLSNRREVEIDNFSRDLKFKTAVNNLLAHDLRAPISNIQKMSVMLKKETDPEIVSELIDYINQSSERTLTIINDLLYISKLESVKKLHKDRVQIVDFIKDACASLKQQAEDKNINIVYQISDEELYVLVEPAMIRRVLDNVINNAIKFSNPNSEIKISVTKNFDELEICFRDHGVGMDATQVSKIFEPYSNLSTKGTAGEKSIGLGMSIVKFILELHQFEIKVESQPGRGTSIYIYMPLYK